MDISLLVKAIRVQVVIWYGNRGPSARDVDLVVVSDDFRGVSRTKRGQLIRKWVADARPIDPIGLTVEEFAGLEHSPDAYSVNVLEGEVIYDSTAGGGVGGRCEHPAWGHEPNAGKGEADQTG